MPAHIKSSPRSGPIEARLLHGCRLFTRLAVLAAFFSAIMACRLDANPPLPYPVWENVTADLPLSVDLVGEQADSVANAPHAQLTQPQEGMANAALPMAALSVPDVIDEEILQLGTALGVGMASEGEEPQNKALRVFNWVRDKIDYQHYYGIRKGSALTLMEGSGNDFDQSILLAELLVASGYPAADVKLRLRAMRVDYERIMEWMGLASEPYPGQTFEEVFGAPITSFFPNGTDQGVGDLVAKRALFAHLFLSSRGARWGSNNGVAIWYPNFPGKATLLFNRMFVQLNIGSQTYDLDPSYKIYSKLEESFDLESATGYSRSELLAAAGGITQTHSVSGMDAQLLGDLLSDWSSALTAKLGGEWAQHTVDEIVSGRFISMEMAETLAQAFPLPGEFFDNGSTYSSPDDPDLNPVKSTIRFQSGGLDYSMYTSSLKGRKLSLDFEGNTARLRIDDGEPVATTNVQNDSLPLTIRLWHPAGVSEKSETKDYRKSNEFVYALIYGFTPSGRLLQHRYEQLGKYLDEGMADSSKEVRSELLNIMGLTWLYHTGLSSRLAASRNDALDFHHHRVGRVAQEEGFYVDVGLQLSGIFMDDSQPGHPSTIQRHNNVFHLTSLFASGMEHGIIEQMQPGSSAVSTVNILRKANETTGNALFRVHSGNWNSVSSTLLSGGYSPTQLDEFEALVNDGATLFLPKNADLTQGIWTGSGWVIHSPSKAGMIINGGYSGGYATQPATVSAPPINTQNLYNPVASYSDASIPALRPVTPPSPSTPPYFGSDPVNMKTGAFTYAAVDLKVGDGTAPRGLSFSRAYSSNQAGREDQTIGYGWTHNLFIRAAQRPAAEAMLGDGPAMPAAPFLTALLAGSDLYQDDSTPAEWGAAVLTVGWLVDQMKNSAVSVRMGADTYQFVRAADGTFIPPAGTTVELLDSPDGYVFRQRHGNAIHFDEEGAATRIVDPDGREMSLTYNEDGQLEEVEDHVGRKLSFSYNNDDRIAAVTDSTLPQRSVSFFYDSDGNLVRATDPSGAATHFDYEVGADPAGTTAGEHLIVRIRNHYGETVTQNVYDQLGRVGTQYLHGDPGKAYHLHYTGRENFEVDPEGGHLYYLYDARGRTAGKRDPEGHGRSTAYDGLDRVISRTTPEGETTHYEYDDFHNVVRIDHPRGGGSSHYSYDSLHRLVESTEPDGSVTRYGYFDSGPLADRDLPSSVIKGFGTPQAATTTYTYHVNGSAAGRIASMTDPDGLVTSYSYDSRGQLASTTEPGGFTTLISYSERGDLTDLTDPLGTRTKYSYDSNRRIITQIEDHDGIEAVTETTYDHQGRVAATRSPDSGGHRVHTTITYSPTDKPLVESVAGVARQSLAYDGRDLAVSSTDALGNTTSTARYPDGMTSQIQRPDGSTTAFAYDDDNRTVEADAPGSDTGTRSKSFAYDETPAGYPRTTYTHADGSTTSDVFDHSGRLRFHTNRKGETFEYQYDPLGRRSGVLAPGGYSRETLYTPGGRISSVTEPSGDSSTFSYHPNTGRLLSASYSGADAATVNYVAYDAAGNLLELNEDGEGTVERTYDALGRVTSRSEGGQTVGYRYHADGRLAKLVYPGGSEQGVGHVEYTYHADGQLHQVLDHLDSVTSPRVSTYQWRDDGRLESLERPNGTVRSISYDVSGRPVEIREQKADGSLLQLHRADYWPSGELRNLVSLPAPDGQSVPTATMGYGAGNRLASFNGQGVVHDADGNMTQGPLPYGGLVDDLSYDSRNRLTSAGTHSYGYDAEGHLALVQNPQGSESLTIDVHGSGLPRVIVRHGPQGTTRVIYGVGLLYEVDASGQATYHHHDAGGSLAALTNEVGSVTARMSYTPYGTLSDVQGEAATPFLYGGFFGLYSDGVGLVHARGRVYNPLTRRFLGLDPVLDGWNWYAYALGNPMAFVDPSGYAASSVLDAVQTGLDFLGLTPGIGAIPDLVNAGISSLRGDATGAALSLTASIPIAGQAAGTAKIIRTIAKTTDAASSTSRVVSSAARGVSPGIKALSEANITDNGITVLGRFQAPPGQMNYIQKATTGKYAGSSYFDLGSAWTPIEGKAANLNFLDIVGGRGEKMIFSTPKNKISAGTSLDMEVQYLQETFGYKWVNQWSMQVK